MQIIQHIIRMISIRPACIAFVMIVSAPVFSQQQVGIGTDTPAPSAIVDFTSTDKGILVPRMTTDERLMIGAPATGLLVFDITTSTFWFHDALDWTELPSHWKQNGDNISNVNSGNVGFGLTNPAFPLDVNGVINSLNPGSSPIGSSISFSSPTGDPGIVLIRGDGAGNLSRRWDLKVDNDQSFRIVDNGHGTRMIVDTTGSVGIGGIYADPSAALHIASTTKGFLPPRMTDAEREAIVLPTEGLMIWCTNCGQYGQIQIYDGSYWTDIDGDTPLLQIGDHYGGGIVAYIFKPGDPGYVAGETHGLIAAASDLPNARWGCYGVNMPGAEGTALGTGHQNTLDILSGCNTPDIAAKICADLVLNGFTDWFLPSKDELNKLFLNRLSIGGFGAVQYWSSTEVDGLNARTQSFLNGFTYISHKAVEYYVRAIRYF